MLLLPLQHYRIAMRAAMYVPDYVCVHAHEQVKWRDGTCIVTGTCTLVLLLPFTY